MRHDNEKVEVEQKAREMAKEAFKVRPSMDEIDLRHYLITEEARSGIPRHGHTTYEAMYLKVYRDLQKQK